MIVFAAFTPHSPLLLPSIGKATFRRLKKTTMALESVAEHLYASFPETLVILSSHSIMHELAFSINLHDEYTPDVSRFGDLSTHPSYLPDLQLIDTIQRSLRRKQMPLTLDSDASLDHGAAVPLLLLTKRLPNIRIVPVSYSGLDPKTHVEFGRALKDVLEASPRRIAVIATGDLSHALTNKAPAGFRKEGKQFDMEVQRAAETVALSPLLNLTDDIVAGAVECAYKPLLMLFGLLEQIHLRPDIQSYEAPVGVGYLVAEFHPV